MNLNIGKTIKRVRKEKNYTQDYIATELGVSYQAVSRWELGLSYPDVEILPKLAGLLGVTLDSLFGMDKEDEGAREAAYNSYDYNNPEELDKIIEITKKNIEDYPGNDFFRFKLISLYHEKGNEYAKGKLDEMRRHCDYIIDHAPQGECPYRHMAVAYLIMHEDEECLDKWLCLLDNRSWISSSEALIRRYDITGEVDKFNKTCQKFLWDTIQLLIGLGFQQRSNEREEKHRFQVNHLKMKLKLIDLFRDTDKDIDPWLDIRMFSYLWLSETEFKRNNREEGYLALEQAVRLSLIHQQIPEGTVLSYNCEALSLIDENLRTHEYFGNLESIYKILGEGTHRNTFEALQGEPRFRAQLKLIEERLGLDRS